MTDRSSAALRMTRFVSALAKAAASAANVMARSDVDVECVARRSFRSVDFRGDHQSRNRDVGIASQRIVGH